MNKLIIANWKMNPFSYKEAEILFQQTSKIKTKEGFKIIVCPPYIYLPIYSKIKNKKVHLGAQNVSANSEGPFTGEVSSKMLSSLRVSYVIVGHSESRQMGDTNELVSKKILNLLKDKLNPILCVGESERDSNGEYLLKIKEQIHVALKGVNKNQIKNIVIAYEPIWAIGSKAIREATREEFMEIKIYIKKIISDMYEPKIAHGLSIIYGGSVDKDNAKEFVSDDGASGLLVGRNCLDPKKFSDVINSLL